MKIIENIKKIYICLTIWMHINDSIKHYVIEYGLQLN